MAGTNRTMNAKVMSGDLCLIRQHPRACLETGKKNAKGNRLGNLTPVEIQKKYLSNASQMPNMISDFPNI
jgi:hypothetical protein